MRLKKTFVNAVVLFLLALLSLPSAKRRQGTLDGSSLVIGTTTRKGNTNETIHFYVDLETDKVVVQLPCIANTFTKETLLEQVVALPSAAGAVIPAYSLQIDLQTFAECQNDATHQKNLQELQEFLHILCPLAEISHDIRSTHASNFLQQIMTNSSSLYQTTFSIAIRAPPVQSQKAPLCSSLRGRYGNWVFNYSYANRSWYIPTKWIRSNELENGPYNHSSWVYESKVPSCPIEMIYLQGFCEAANALNISRIMVLGDSIEFMRLISFFHLLGIPSLVHLHLRPRYRHRYSYIFKECHFSPIELVFYRSNHLMPLLGNKTLEMDSLERSDGQINVTQVQLSRRAQYMQRSVAEGLTRNDIEYFLCAGGKTGFFADEKGWCPWTHEYLNYDQEKRTMLIGGVGPHFHYTRLFREQLDRFMNVVRTHQRPNDIVWLRTVLEGHENCVDETNPVAPLQTFQEFKENYFKEERVYTWHLYHKFNKMMEKEVLKIQMDKNWKGASFQLFDVYWMIALRRDGHPSRNDCLHYLLPGPPDWWNHLFYSNLRERARQFQIAAMQPSEVL